MLKIEDIKTKKYIGTCSGTLIAKNQILTAAHCIDKSKNIVTKVYCHEKSKSKKKTYIANMKNVTKTQQLLDLAVIQLDKSLPIRPMKIAGESAILNLKDTGSYQCAAFGYGLDNHSKSGKVHGSKIDILDLDSEYYYNFHMTQIIIAQLNDSEEQYNILKGTSFEGSLLHKLLLVKNAHIFLQMYFNSGLVTRKEYSYFQEFLQAQLQKEYIKRMTKASEVDLSFILNTKSFSLKTDHTSVVRPGDSGGTIACLGEDGHYTLVGVISNLKAIKKLKFELFYPKYKEIATDGASIPLVGAARAFLDKSMKIFSSTYSTQGLDYNVEKEKQTLIREINLFSGLTPKK